eukprot:g6282.t2
MLEDEDHVVSWDRLKYKEATRPGHKLLRRKTCSMCSPETGGLGAVATELLDMVDLLQSRGDIFRSTRGRFVTLQHKYPELRPETSACRVVRAPDIKEYGIDQPRTWFRMSVKVATFALQVLCTTLSSMALAPLSGGGAAVEATVSAALGTFESMLQHRLEGLTLDDDAAAVDVAPQSAKTAQLEGGAYSSLREFVHGVDDTASLESFEARKKTHKERHAPPSSSDLCFSRRR